MSNSEVRRKLLIPPVQSEEAVVNLNELRWLEHVLHMSI